MTININEVPTSIPTVSGDALVAQVEADRAAAETARDQAQTAAANAQAASRSPATWAILSTLTGAVEAEGAEVPDTDTGTHTDPVTGATVPNGGKYSWSVSPVGWERTGDTGLSAKTSRTTVDTGSGSDLVLRDALGFVAARMGAAGARAKNWRITPDRIVGGGMDIYAADVDGPTIVDRLGFISRLATMGAVRAYIASLGLTDQRLTTDGTGLYHVRGKLAAAALGMAGVTAKIGWIGDSYTEYGHITNALANLLYARYGQGGSGWMGAGSTQEKPGGAGHWYTGCTLHDITSERGSPTGYYGPSGMWLEATGTTETIWWAAVRAAEMRLYYVDGTGTFRYQVDGGSWVTVAGGSTGNPAKITITGLDPAVSHRIDIDTTGNTGVVRIAGLYATGMAGAELSCIGNAGATARDMAVRIDCAMRDYVLADIALDAAVIQFGANDAGQPDDPSTVYAPAIEALIGDLVAINANCGAILAATQELLSSYPGLRAYTDACKAIALATTQCEWIDMWTLFGPYSKTYPALYDDPIHPNATGGRVWAGHIFNNFLTI